MKLHHKGYMLVYLEQHGTLWDKVLIDAAQSEYALSGSYWVKHFSIILDELAAAGLIIREAHRLDNVSNRLMFKYAMSDFGRERMRDTGLLQA
ncbi:hypothetical protein [Methylophaga sp. OBS4]|jgi:hypothetical protein|uniref:hypothetical protein n=1 Tax=Methylophaga sp. OBS4 TaxID=2991935 RepID=UPI0022554690|nr:hypothetical protein [Methylophaga sp. OBS4]MCX4187084.1 hypothetical protein [Methylophaga sp. OBS4]